MVDSVKNYGITGVGSTVELGKKGNKIVGTSAKVSLTENDGTTLLRANIADGTLAEHAVTKSQLDTISGQTVTMFTATVNYNSGNVSLGNLQANGYIHSVTVEKSTNWTDADSATNITVGDDSDTDRLFVSFDPTAQVTDETDYKYTADTEIKAYVNAGGASAGTAKIAILYSGTLT